MSGIATQLIVEVALAVPQALPATLQSHTDDKIVLVDNAATSPIATASTVESAIAVLAADTLRQTAITVLDGSTSGFVPGMFSTAQTVETTNAFSQALLTDYVPETGEFIYYVEGTGGGLVDPGDLPSTGGGGAASGFYWG
jgi:hypothetical protein